ncbi:MAG TPA: VWA domain-containing protein [Acidimicrobiales bacterium]
MPEPDGPFAIESFQNPYLAEGAARVDAILSVTATSTAPTGSSPPLLLGFIVDTSGSMQGERIRAVRAAVESAVHLLDETARFFVVAFANYARVVVPPTAATPASKAAAAAAVHQLEASGGTAMSQGLAAARSLYANEPDAIAECVFLTDGKNESEPPGEVGRELVQCAGVFSCDCWGVGTDWRVGEVQEIASSLLGKASLIPEAEGIEGAFRAAVEKAQTKSVKDVRLRVWTPAGATILSLKQVSPTIEDLTSRAVPVSAQVVDYDTGAWGPGEARDYQLAVQVAPGRIGDEMLAARPSVVYRSADGSESEVKAPTARVFASWTADETLSSRLDGTVAHYNGQDELASAIQQGLEAREQGDEASATELLGRAVRIAHESENGEMTTRLTKVVDILDPVEGTVRLKHAVAKAAAMDLELESTTTRRARRPGTPA